MAFFILSLVPLVIAPILYLGIQQLEERYWLIERSIFVIIAILVLLHIFPEAFSLAGPWVIGIALVGWFLPSLLERVWTHGAEQVHWISFFIAALGLCLHGLLDGMALGLGAMFLPQEPEWSWSTMRNQLLPLAVVLHRFPEAIFLWWMIHPKYGAALAVTMLIFVGAMTGVGYWVAFNGGPVFHQEFGVGLFQALVGGSLLHVATHRVTAPIHKENRHHHHHGHHHHH